jgi:hypothetical protein
MQVIIIAQLHAMYQRSTKMLIFLVVNFLAIEITITLFSIVPNSDVSGGKLRF